MTPEELATLRPGHVVINDSGPTFHIIERRKDDDTGWWMTDGSGLADRVALGDPWWTVASFIVSLFRWKAEAKTVLSTWEAVWEALGKPGTLGDSKAAAVLAEVTRLRDVNAELRTDCAAWMEAADTYRSSRDASDHRAEDLRAERDEANRRNRLTIERNAEILAENERLTATLARVTCPKRPGAQR